MSYEVLKKRLTRGDESTKPGGIILRKRVDAYGPGQHEFIVHRFSRNYGSDEPLDFFYGSYHKEERSAGTAFFEKLSLAKQWDRGGSLIPIEDEDFEIATELAEHCVV